MPDKLESDVPEKVLMDADAIISEFGEKIRARLEKGRVTYGSNFYSHTNPVVDLEEELLDAIVYLYVLRKMGKWQEGQ